MGVDPDRIVESAINDADLEQYRCAHAMSLVRPVVRKLLVEDVTDTGLLVAISDAGGRLLWVEGDSAAKDRALRINFAEGVDWGEASAGTNAPGTALAVDRCVQIVGAEHFVRTVKGWSCSAAPVHDPMSGLILGAIDITGGPRVAMPEVLSLVRATVAAAESELRIRLLSSPGILLSGCSRLQLLGGHPALTRAGERIALSPRHAEILLLLLEHPEGLTTDHLGVLLDEGALDAVTVRAEVSRLRKIVGPEALSSRPYRLLIELESDLSEVRRHLDCGDLRSALALYGGPVLPASEAPGVYRVREDLRARIQAAVLREGDPVSLRRWTETVEGREDCAAWLAYLTTLEPNSSLFAQVKARVEVLEREFGW